MKKLTILLMILCFNVQASDEKQTDVFSYSDFNVNHSLSLYAGKINMDYFLEDEAYSVGLLLHNESHANLDFGCGYIQPSSKFSQFTQVESELISKTADDDGILFFMNYNF